MRCVVLRTQVELKQTAEKLHVQNISTTMNQTEAFKLMMREKEALIAEKYQLTDKVNTLRKQSKVAEEKWQRDKEALETSVSEKSSALDEMKSGRERLQSEIARLKVNNRLTTTLPLLSTVIIIRGFEAFYNSTKDINEH